MSTSRIHPPSVKLRRIHRRLIVEELEPRIVPDVGGLPPSPTSWRAGTRCSTRRLTS